MPCDNADHRHPARFDRDLSCLYGAVRADRVGRNRRLLFALPVLKLEKSPLLLIPAALALAAFAWLLTLHPTAAGRTYAAYGGVYIAVALLWLRIVDGLPLTRWDVLGAAVALAGMAIIVLQPASGAGTG